MNPLKAAANFLKIKGSGTTPFDAAGHGRRSFGWNSSQLGINTLLYSHGLDLLYRNRDTVRNNGWANCAMESYTAHAIGKGVRLISECEDVTIRQQITDKWNCWIEECDMEYEESNPGSGQSDFYGLQIMAAREIMEAGEVFIKYLTRSPSEKLTVPLQLQIIEAEQLPIWRMDTSNIPDQNRVRFGIEFRPDNRRAAYHFWKQHPGETLFYPTEALQIERVLAKDVLHVYKPVRAGQLRGMPWMTPVLAKLYSLDKYMDSEIFRKEVSSMITGFIKQIIPNDNTMPADLNVAQPQDVSKQIARLEPGSFPVLNAGEEIQFADVKDSGDYSRFIKTGLQAFASGLGLSEYQISGDLTGISYSSIRAGVLEFRRKCEQFQHAIFIHQFCRPIFYRWLDDAMMNLCFGVPALNKYNKDKRFFRESKFVTPGWPWVDPEKEVKALEQGVRDGFTSRTIVCAQQGIDSADVDSQQVLDNERADNLKLSYDSDGRKVLTGRNAGLTEEEITAESEKGEIGPTA